MNSYWNEIEVNVSGEVGFKMNGLDYHLVRPAVEFQAPVTQKECNPDSVERWWQAPSIKNLSSARPNCNADKVLDWTKEINLHVNDMWYDAQEHKQRQTYMISLVIILM